MSSSAPSSASSSSVARSTSGSSPSSSASSPVSSADDASPSSPASSTPSPSSTTNSPTTSASSTTSAAPTTTPQSSPAQTSSPAGKTTTASPASSASAGSPSTAAPQTSSTPSTSSFTSQVATTISSTDAQGSIVLLTSTVPEVFTTSAVSPSSSSSSSNNTGVIVGSVVGGVAGIAILALLLFCIRKRVRRDDFDGNFDPDHVVGHNEGGGTLPQVDLADEVTPFPQNQSYAEQGSMRQFGKSPYIPMPSSLGPSGHGDSDFYASEAGMSTMDTQPRTVMQPGVGMPPSGAYIPPINMYGTGPVDWHTPRPGASPPPSTVSNTTTSTRAAKEREAMGRGGQGAGLGLATQPEVAEGSGDVVVHQDAGRAPIEEHAPPREIPPSYDSIQRD